MLGMQTGVEIVPAGVVSGGWKKGVLSLTFRKREDCNHPEVGR